MLKKLLAFIYGVVAIWLTLSFVARFYNPFDLHHTPVSFDGVGLVGVVYVLLYIAIVWMFSWLSWKGFSSKDTLPAKIPFVFLAPTIIIFMLAGIFLLFCLPFPSGSTLACYPSLLTPN